MKLTKMFALLLAIILAVTSIPEYASADSGMIEIGKWDCIYFGRYYQNDTNGDGKVNLSDEMEPVRWRILSRSGNRALLLSDKILDAGKYNDKDENCTWETCGMRKWLNNTFYKTAFDEKEQAAIQTRTVVNVAAETFQGAEGGNPTQDKVYLLSYDEAMNTGYAFEFCDKYQASNTRSASNTAYAATKPYRYSNTESADAWWLRGSGATNDTAMYVFPDGGISEIMDVDTVAGIRPVVYVDLSDDELWSDAGTETAHDFPNEGEINGVESGAEDVPIIPAEPEEDMPGEDLPDESLPSDTPDDSSSDSANPSPSRVAENHLKFMEYSSEGTVESNAGNSHGYVDEKRWAQPVKAYLKETDNGFMRVEAYSDSVVVEEYSDSFQLTGQQKLDMELPLFGGCFCGDSYNFLVFGQNNPDESDETEVVRIVKYDKEWNRLDAASVRGANTSVPFDAGSLRMAESQDMLYIHTCHEMYKSSDGVNHQANMTFVLDELSMTIHQSQYNVKNISFGYVSHSFNQFVKTDGNYLYRLDHGDAYPRAVVLTRARTDDILSCISQNVLSIEGNRGANDTGVEVGGFELAGDRLIAAGNSVAQGEDYSAFAQRNIFITSTDTELENTEITWLTNYKEGSKREVGNPHLVKVSENELYMLWEEQDAENFTTLKVACINAAGVLQGNIHTLYAKLAGCAPIYTKKGEIVWYKNTGSSLVFYHISPDKLDEYEFEGRVELKNCQITLKPERMEYTIYDAYKPEVSITCGDYVLKVNEDYRISYDNNYSVGTATVTLTGMELFRGTETRNFEIVEKKSDSSDNAGNTGNTGQTPSLPSTGNSGQQTDVDFDYGGGYTGYWPVGSTSSKNKKVKKPGRVKIRYVYVQKKKLVVSWKWKSNVAGFQLQYAQNKKFTKKKKTKSFGEYKSSATIKGLKKGKKYYVRVRAYRKKSGKKLCGKWSKVKGRKI